MEETNESLRCDLFIAVADRVFAARLGFGAGALLSGQDDNDCRGHRSRWSGRSPDKGAGSFFAEAHPRKSDDRRRAQGGGGGRQAANYMYQTAKPDGLTVGALSGSIVALNILGATGVMYDIDKFSYLGSSESTSHQIMYTRKELGLAILKSFERLPASGSAPRQSGIPTTWLAGFLPITSWV
jgi:hypothetical protein